MREGEEEICQWASLWYPVSAGAWGRFIDPQERVSRGMGTHGQIAPEPDRRVSGSSRMKLELESIRTRSSISIPGKDDEAAEMHVIRA